MDRCVFCGQEGNDFDPEHWIPQWLSREVVPSRAEKFIHHLHRGGKLLTWESPIFSHTVEHVCSACNGGWLSDIETKAKPHVLPWILGNLTEPPTADDLIWLARWCYLKVISLELGRPKEHTPTHPDATYAAFRTSRSPPYPNCSLALGFREIHNPRPVFVWFKTQGLAFGRNPGVPDAHGYHTTLLVGHLVIDAYGLHAPIRLDVEHGDGFHVLWPLPVTGGTFHWPPSRHFTGIVDDELV